MLLVLVDSVKETLCGVRAGGVVGTWSGGIQPGGGARSWENFMEGKRYDIRQQRDYCVYQVEVGQPPLLSSVP